MLLEQERSLPSGEQFVAGVLADPGSSGLTEKEKLLFTLMDQVNHHSPQIQMSDLDAVRSAGWTDEQIYFAITVCALFNFYNRWIDASGVPPLSDEAHRAGGKRSAAAGYVRK